MIKNFRNINRETQQKAPKSIQLSIIRNRHVSQATARTVNTHQSDDIAQNSNTTLFSLRTENFHKLITNSIKPKHHHDTRAKKKK